MLSKQNPIGRAAERRAERTNTTLPSQPNALCVSVVCALRARCELNNSDASERRLVVLTCVMWTHSLEMRRGEHMRSSVVHLVCGVCITATCTLNIWMKPATASADDGGGQRQRYVPSFWVRANNKTHNGPTGNGHERERARAPHRTPHR